MGLLSKIFGGDKDVEKAAKDLLKGIIDNAQQNQQVSAGEDESAHKAESSPSGFSWGEKMPAEENQYNYNGSFDEYFEGLFRSEFPELRYEKDEISPNRRIVYTFYSGDSKALVVELMSEKSSARKLRNDCKKEGVPYLRFYFDHEGWWNTRSYVVGRMRDAIG